MAGFSVYSVRTWVEEGICRKIFSSPLNYAWPPFLLFLMLSNACLCPHLQKIPSREINKWKMTLSYILTLHSLDSCCFAINYFLAVCCISFQQLFILKRWHDFTISLLSERYFSASLKMLPILTLNLWDAESCRELSWIDAYTPVLDPSALYEKKLSVFWWLTWDGF